jgi:hypothetical protein
VVADAAAAHGLPGKSVGGDRKEPLMSAKGADVLRCGYTTFTGSSPNRILMDAATLMRAVLVAAPVKVRKYDVTERQSAIRLGAPTVTMSQAVAAAYRRRAWDLLSPSLLSLPGP